MQFKDKKLLLFDLDGTLIDSVPDLAASINFMLQQLGKKEFSENTIRNWVGNGAKTLVQRALNEPNNTQALEIFLTHYKNNLCNNTTLYPFVKQTLAKLYKRGFTLAIITNKPFEFIEPILQKLEIDSYFSLLLGANSLKNKKPHKEPLEYACKTLGFTKQETLMIGDSKNDILAAQAANIESVAVNYGYNYDEDIQKHNPTTIIENFEEILTLLSPKVAIIGGGIAGSSVAIYLGELGIDTTLFEQNSSLVDGPPICHLHSGGNLYREISDEQCLQLLKESIELIRLYPFSIDLRPTLLITPKTDDANPLDLLPRLQKLQKEYAKLIQQDPKNKLLGEVSNYFTILSKENLLQKKNQKYFDVIVKEIDFSKIKFPIIMVQEYGLNIFRLAASATLMLKELSNVKVLLNTPVTNMEKKGNKFLINNNHYDYLINAAGFKSGEIDDMLHVKRKRFVEFKAAYVTKSNFDSTKWPEIIFFGKRGTPQGMAQFTPYADGYFQLHGMTQDITLFENGLVKSSSLSAQPKLDTKFLNKIYKGWNIQSVEQRTQKAIQHIAQFIPSFKEATFTPKPLYGAQQIPGDDADLRAAEVSFEWNNYARCEIVKGSSVLAMSDAIVKKFHITFNRYNIKEFDTVQQLSKEVIDKEATKIAKERKYPISLSKLNNTLKI